MDASDDEETVFVIPKIVKSREITNIQKKIEVTAVFVEIFVFFVCENQIDTLSNHNKIHDTHPPTHLQKWYSFPPIIVEPADYYTVSYTAPPRLRLLRQIVSQICQWRLCASGTTSVADEK